MTANEMASRFDLLFDSLYEAVAPAYSDSMKSELLTVANNRVFFDAYYPLANKYKRGFEMDEAKLRDLEQYLKNDTPSASATQTGARLNGVIYDLPTDFLYSVEESAITNLSIPDEVSVKPVTHDEYGANRKNPYKKPYSDLVWRLGVSRVTQPTGTTTASVPRTELITDGSYTITTYRLVYLMLPPSIVVDTATPVNQRHSYLNEMLQEKVVTMAVKIASGAVKPEEYQIKSLEVLDSE
jgi:hypothetical protein